jgi:monothiol glutaredoxin
MRPQLNQSQIHPHALKKMESYHIEIVDEISSALTKNEWVIVGMSHNPFVKKARKLLEEKKISCAYMEYGNYFSHWKKRLAIKLWSGWPTFPQVFHKGVLIGGFVDLQNYLVVEVKS